MGHLLSHPSAQGRSGSGWALPGGHEGKVEPVSGPDRASTRASGRVLLEHPEHLHNARGSSQGFRDGAIDGIQFTEWCQLGPQRLERATMDGVQMPRDVVLAASGLASLL